AQYIKDLIYSFHINGLKNEKKFLGKLFRILNATVQS
ncbi:unnamed protein product, partial [marine sediment metagenome]